MSEISEAADIRREAGGAGPGIGLWQAARSSAVPGRYAFGQSTLSVQDGIWHLKTREASYRETGIAVGRLLAQSDYPGIGLFRGWRARAVINLLWAITRRDFRRIRIPERYLEELSGYAEGSGIPYRALYFMNFIFDILKKYGFHCSSVAFSGSGTTIVGRNTDLLPWIAQLALKWFPPVVMDVAVPGKHRYVHVTPGLFLGVLGGFNERGIAMMSHQIAATREESVPGNLATTLLQRMILEESEDLEGADAVIRGNPIQRCISNLVTSHAEGKSRVYEITPQSIKVANDNGTFLCCATHFNDDELSLLSRKKTTISEQRLALMNRLAENSKPVPEHVIAILKNTDNGLGHKNSGQSPTNDGTYQSLVFDVSGGRILISDGTKLPVSLTGRYREIVINDA
ncbi:MAG TPA: C45 family peptidase [Candidatus Cybelea sp.]|nr:C45 family peptidase [Candidatus Cybelea sp.]